jgi:protein-S-isoprenylcysteine O-methyltransferase Ste14
MDLKRRKMGSGFNEIALVALIAFIIFFLPRLKKRRQEIQFVKPPQKSLIVSGRLRLAIFVSILWAAGAALFLQPWNENPSLFLLVGIGPVFLGWGLMWVIEGYRKYRR